MVSQEEVTSTNRNDPMQRVKVFRLNDEEKWDEKGTGHVTVDYLERSEELGLYVMDEDNNKTLLLHRISSEDIYRKQEDTIISWRDPDFSTELALSFQDPTGFSYIWDHICSVQRNMQFNNLSSKCLPQHPLFPCADNGNFQTSLLTNTFKIVSLVYLELTFRKKVCILLAGFVFIVLFWNRKTSNSRPLVYEDLGLILYSTLQNLHIICLGVSHFLALFGIKDQLSMLWSSGVSEFVLLGIFGFRIFGLEDLRITSNKLNFFFADEAFHNDNSELRELPPVDLTTLHSIHKIIVGSGILDQLHVRELILHDQAFFRKLMDLFRECEGLSNRGGLHMICKIVRGIILLNSPPIFERMFGDELMMDVIGCLEYDPDVSQSHYRDFLKDHVVFKEAIPIKDPLVLSKIHQTYRIVYLKDVVLSRVLDDATIGNLNSIIHSNNATVVSLLKDDSTFIQELFAKLTSPSTSTESKKNLVRFLQEFCTLSKSLQMVQQLRLSRDLVGEGVFDIICDVLQSEDKTLALIGTDILVLFMNQDPNLLRSFVARPEGASLFGLLVKGMLTDFGDDMHCQFLEIIRSLLDSHTTGAQRDDVVEIFYEKHLDQLIDGIISSCPSVIPGQSVGKDATSSQRGNQRNLNPEILLNICDLLCFCVVHHPFIIKSNFLPNNVISKVMNLTRRRENYLVVAAVRFMRTLISRNDEHMLNHIVKHNILKPIVDVFIANGSRYNLLNSAVLEFFEFIRKDHFKVLLKYIVETFWSELIEFEKVFPSICSLKVKYEQSLESSGLRTSLAAIDTRKRIDERALEKEEEDYFNEGSDEEDSASAATNANGILLCSGSVSNRGAGDYPRGRPGGVIDYDDDEDYKPPPRKRSEVVDEDEGIRLKRKLSANNKPKAKRLQMLPKTLKPNCSLVFSSLNSGKSNAAPACKKRSSSSEAKEYDEQKKPISISRTREADSSNDESTRRSSSDGLSKAIDSRQQEKEEAVSSKHQSTPKSSDIDNKKREDDPLPSTEMAAYFHNA